MIKEDQREDVSALKDLGPVCQFAGSHGQEDEKATYFRLDNSSNSKVPPRTKRKTKEKLPNNHTNNKMADKSSRIIGGEAK